MELVQIIGIGLVGTFLYLLVKEQKPEIALQIGLVAGALIFFLLLGKLTAVIFTIQQLAGRANVNPVYLNTIFRVLGVAYLAGFASQICRDAGQGSIATRIDMAAKVLIMFMAIPILSAIIETVLRLL
ncbi:MAG TPA: stage III sporulation protein AD [Firmicutes bacterium]|jgi:stage III sporulation protein AD|nr:stage III sporulation protein AD [Bacillota bacterium]HAW71922.1 stage III sporulation protein AD [Bacillota bacterium]HAZ22549.1 stage III sporulation protein AD [Bacillota bacterium]HBE06265.1 stage III sporulation protein AD [Bacillota bacterium]HBG43467.1 stage III sporulation protein AD [Bacillota bacterium]